ncbi:MAG: HlyC/CorC family transporter [Hyphomicrobiaceae bacterium]
MEIDLETWLTGGAILLLLGASAFCSGSETALTAASRARMHQLEVDGNRRAGVVNRLINARQRLLGALLITNNIVNTLSAALATGFLIRLFGQAGIAYATIGMTLLLVIFGEVLPKTYAINHPDRMSLAVAPIMRAIVVILTPINMAVQAIVRGLLWLLGAGAAATADEEAAHEELRGAIDLHHKEGSVAQLDRDMLGGILDLKELEVSDIMVHRTKMETVCADDPVGKLVEDALSSAFTRIPVWRGDPDNIIGILHVKDLLRELHKSRWDLATIDVAAIAGDTWFIPDTTNLKDQLGAFLKRKAHIALVVDEYGEVMGLVTLEDIIEEIVGQITDEHDRPDPQIRPQSDGRVIVDGSTPIRDLNRHMDWNLPDDEATTIAGLVIHEAQIIPESGQQFTFYGYRFEILRKSRNRIMALRVTPLVERGVAGPAETG